MPTDQMKQLDYAVSTPRMPAGRRIGGKKKMSVAFLSSLLLAALVAAGSVLPNAVAGSQAASLSHRALVHPVFGRNGMVSTQEATATRVGLDVLKRGGNAVDAAVAVGFALAVTLPRAGNLGGGGFMLIYLADRSKTIAIDYREAAPAAATRDMYLDAGGSVSRIRSRFSYPSAGVPGTVAGLSLAQERFGAWPLKKVIEPAIRLAKKGITVTPVLAASIQRSRERLARWPHTARIFLKSDGSPPAAGERLFQRDLAWSLREIASHGSKAFYAGAIAERIAADMAANDGLITLADLNNYRAVMRQPVRGTYRGYSVRSMPPPSSGGIHLVQLLNILEGYRIARLGHNGAETIHLMAEAMKLAYADRSRHLGDPDFWPVPVSGLTSKAYAAVLRNRIDPKRARPSVDIAPRNLADYESDQTTHFSVMDRWGNVVSNTYTINFSYGSGIVAGGTGILLNNEMDDFSAKPGVPNAYGLIGGEANAIEAGKRPLSSMAPTIVLKDGKPYLATGSPGGSRIITTTLQVIMNVVDHGMNIAAATHAPRVHHQWLPDVLRLEPGISPDTLALLAAKGHKLDAADAMGGTQSIVHTEEAYFGASDPRRPGALTAGY